MESPWTNFSSSSEKFSASFPSKVNRQFHGHFQDDGLSPASIHFSSSDTNDVLYEVRVTRLMQIFGPITDFLELAVNEMSKSISNSKVIRTDFLSFKNHQAIGFELQVDTITTVLGIAMVHEKTLYLLSTLFGVATDHQFIRFIDKFDLHHTEGTQNSGIGPDA